MDKALIISNVNCWNVFALDRNNLKLFELGNMVRRGSRNKWVCIGITFHESEKKKRMDKSLIFNKAFDSDRSVGSWIFDGNKVNALIEIV